jgi:hypothetical protein
MTPRDVIPAAWTSLLRDGPVTFGLDLGTTEKKTSNPSSLTVTEKWDGLYIERLVTAWKTKDEAITKAILEIVVDDLILSGRKWRCGCIDASNETYYASILQKMVKRRCTVHLIKGGEKLKHGLQEMDSKTLLGSLYVNAHSDGLLATPEGTWIKDDRRLVKRDKGRFEADLGKLGEHGDTFDSGKLAYWGQLRGGGGVHAEAVSTSGSARGDDEDWGSASKYLSNEPIVYNAC